jgi:hypothetical protein
VTPPHPARTSPRAIRLVALVALLALTACGSGGLSPERFAQEANAICTSANDEVRMLGPEPPILTIEQADWLMRLTKIDRSALDRLRALRPPAEERRATESMISLFGRGLAKGEAIARASRAADDAAFRRNVDAALALLRQAQAYARRYGLDECARLGTVAR